MNRMIGLLTIAAVSVALLAVSSADAQRPWPYRPGRPTISPYMNLYRANPGPVDNYHLYVRPQQQLLNTLQWQDQALQQQGAHLQSLRQEVSGFGQRRIATPTGIGAGFMNYSHYYPGLAPVAQPLQR